MLWQILMVAHVLLALGLVVVILVFQEGKGAAAGAAFGAGASGTVFGSRGGGSFFGRVTAVLATFFFITSMSLAYFAERAQGPASISERFQEQTEEPSINLFPEDGTELPSLPGADELLPADQGAAPEDGDGG